MTLTLIENLQNPTLYDHPVSDFKVLETHISWVLLTGDYAYKFKKPVDFGFVDFTSLAKRRHYCFEELRLNRRLAPDLYLDVVLLTGNPEQPSLQSAESESGIPATDIIEYAVKMRQFDQSALLDQIAAAGGLSASYIDALAEKVALFHQQLPAVAMDSELGTAAQVNTWTDQNFEQMQPLLQNSEQREQLMQLKEWTEQAKRRSANTLQLRKKQGFIRECHGDMHLGNMVLIDGQVTVFDGIDFNSELRWIDVMNEIAFVVMDLHDRAYPGLAHRFLDQYLQHTGDYAGLAILRYYLVYRAIVRAKIDLLRLQQDSLPSQKINATLNEYQSYIELALQFSRQQKPVLLITHGLSASGKSTLATELVETLGLIRIRTDVERKRLFNLTASASSGSGLNTGIYQDNVTRQTYQAVAELAESVLRSAYPVLIDATFLARWQRELFQQLAEKLELDFIVIDLQAPEAVLKERIEQRQKQANDASEADLKVLRSQLQTQEPLTAEEQNHSITIDTTRLSISDAGKLIQELIQEICFHPDNAEYSDNADDTAVR